MASFILEACRALGGEKRKSAPVTTSGTVAGTGLVFVFRAS